MEIKLFTFHLHDLVIERVSGSLAIVMEETISCSENYGVRIRRIQDGKIRYASAINLQIL